MGIAYRREIDGLRAIAVSAVVLYHAGLGGAGFVGVDVFFVISGYLITALLLREERINLTAFYARRVRRIFPAAIAVILATLAAAHVLLPSEAEAGVIRSAAAAALFAANLFFASLTSGYFHADTAQMPLLHLWSLSVEEQFYLAWPLLLMLVPRRKLLPTLAGLALASFGLTEWLMQSNPSTAFYQMPARSWELAIGGIVAVLPARPLHRYLAPAGLLLTVAACIYPFGHFPGLGALPAVLGATLLISALHGGATNSLLASRPFVGIGLISYSLYLWHWPLLALYRATSIGEGDLQTRLMLCVIAVVLATGTYRYIETPFRKLRLPDGRTVAGGFAAMAILFCAAWAYTPPEQVEVRALYPEHCHATVEGQPVPMQHRRCLGKEPKVVIWGDSQARAWTPMAQSLAGKLQLPATTLAHDGCPPLLGANLTLRSPVEAINCDKWNREAASYLSTNGADTVIIVARWRMFIQPGTDAADALVLSVDAISPYVRRILVIGPTPELTDHPDKCAAMNVDCAVSRASYLAEADAALQALTRLESNSKVTIANAADWLCNGAVCPGIRNGVALYSDEAHVSDATARGYSVEVAKTWR